MNLIMRLRSMRMASRFGISWQRVLNAGARGPERLGRASLHHGIDNSANVSKRCAMISFAKTVACCLIVSVVGCAPRAAKVFSGPVETWDARARQLPLDQRYEAFRYGITKMKPPVILDDPMADGGEAAASRIIENNSARPNDYVIVGSVHVQQDESQAHLEHLRLARIWYRKNSDCSTYNLHMWQRYLTYLGEVCPKFGLQR